MFQQKYWDVSNNVNLNRILKYDLCYKELGCIQTSHDYVDRVQNNVFMMIKQLGSLTFFLTFITNVNNWLPLVNTLKELQNQHFDENIIIEYDSQSLRKLVGNELVTCVHYY